MLCIWFTPIPVPDRCYRSRFTLVSAPSAGADTAAISGLGLAGRYDDAINQLMAEPYESPDDQSILAHPQSV